MWYIITLHTVSGPIKKASVSSDDYSSDAMDVEETGLVTVELLETNLNRLREEEQELLSQQKVMETAGTYDDIATLELLDALRLNQVGSNPCICCQKCYAKI